MNSKKLIEVAGFQCEPERSEETQGEIYRDNGDEKSEGDIMGQDSRIFSDPWTSCKCGKCCNMPTEKKCLCCKEVDISTFRHIQFDISTYIVTKDRQLNQINLVL